MIPDKETLEKILPKKGIGVLQKAFEEKLHPRDHDGQFRRKGAGLFQDVLSGTQTKQQKADASSLEMAKAMRGSGIKLGRFGPATEVTPEIAKQWGQAVGDVVSRFPEITKPKHGGQRLRQIEFSSAPESEWGQGQVEEMNFMHAFEGQLTGGVTGKGGPGTHILMNESEETAAGSLRMAQVAKAKNHPHWFSPGSFDAKGQMYHELGHAVARSTGIENDFDGAPDKFDALFQKYGLYQYSKSISEYASNGGGAEAFGELFATYMEGKMSPENKIKFEKLLKDLLS